MNITWKPVVGFEGLYEISSVGNVKALKRTVQRKRSGIMTYPERILKPHYNSGYLSISLHKDGVINTYKVHRLVALAFVPNPNNYPQVNHNDDVKTNNDFMNLSWGTQQQNIKQAMDNGRFKFCDQRNGTVISEDLADRIRHVHKKGCKTAWISDLLGIGNTTVRHVLSGRTWMYKTGGNK